MPRQSYSNLVAIVGRPNVGKSSLFNKLIKRRRSLVHDQPGVTRDRLFGRAEHDGTPFYVCDTGGFEPTSKDNVKTQLVEQAELAIEEAEVIIFVVDGREGFHAVDAELLRRIRKAGKKFIVAVNKCDLAMHDTFVEDFRRLGSKYTFAVSAEHGRNIGDMLDVVMDLFEKKSQTDDAADDLIKIAIIGRPNVGKSSILNRLIGEKRSIVDDKPGTTRDTVDVNIRFEGQNFQVLDTAGIRRKSRMADKLEKFSALRSLEALEQCNVSVLVIDASEGTTDSDARVVGEAFEQRKPILIVVNKWDLIKDKDNQTSKKFEDHLRKDLRYIPYSPILFTSAVENQRISRILGMCLHLHKQATTRVKTSKLNNTLREILIKHTPPLTKNRGRRIKFLYATQVSVSPPTFVIFCSDPDDVHFSYKRFLENEFRAAFGFLDIPIAIFFRQRGSPKSKNLDERKIPDIRDVDVFSEELLNEADMATE